MPERTPDSPRPIIRFSWPARLNHEGNALRWEIAVQGEAWQCLWCLMAWYGV
jgi:hypothetical protein